MNDLPIAATKDTNVKTAVLGKIHGFEHLRAICCFSVVFLHTNVMSLLGNYRLAYNILIYNLFYLAVPIFFQMALVLFFLKREKQKDYFADKRLFKLLQLYFFWGLFSHLFYLLYDYQTYLHYLQRLDVVQLLLFIIRDGYGNPFYFFFSLLLLTCLSEVLAIAVDKLDELEISSQLISYVGLVLSCGIVLCLPLSVLLFGKNFIFLPQAAIPLNFIPYVFSSFLISKYVSNHQKKNEQASFYIPFFTSLTLFLACSWLEWHYISNTIPWEGGTIDSLPMYSRVSLVFGAWWVTLLAIKIKSEANWILKLLSNVSLGIYCLHTFTAILLYSFFGQEPPTDAYLKIGVFLFCFFSSLLLTLFFKRIPFLKEYV